jgi:phospholipase/carboxylesterase
MAVRRLDGPRLAPTRGPATHLVVLCHGYGANGTDLIELARHWQPQLPSVAFAAPDAPDACIGAPIGRQWFPLSRMDRAEMEKGVDYAAESFDGFLDAELARLKLPPDRLALVGFSQGTMLSLHVGLKRGAKPAAIIGYSGLLAADPPAGLTAPPPVLLVHGDADQTIPVQALFASATTLGRAGVTVQWHIAQGLGHSIDGDGLFLGGLFLMMGFRGMLAAGSGAISCAIGG